MKNHKFVSVVIGLLFLLGSFCSLAQGQEYLQQEDLQLDSPSPISIDILDETLADVSSLNVSNSVTGSVDGYWVEFSGPTWTRAIVKIDLMQSGLPEKTITEVYKINKGFTGTLRTPFAINNFQGATLGTGSATVTFWNGTTLLGSASHSFNLIPN